MGCSKVPVEVVAGGLVRCGGDARPREGVEPGKVVRVPTGELGTLDTTPTATPSPELGAGPGPGCPGGLEDELVAGDATLKL